MIIENQDDKSIPQNENVPDNTSGQNDQLADEHISAAESGIQTDKEPPARMLAMLDEITNAPQNTKSDTETGEVANIEEPKSDKESVDPASDSAEPTEDNEEADLLDGVKSERGRERIRQVFLEKKQLQQDINEFRDIVKSSGMNAQEFAQTIEIGRLINSGDEKNIRVALEMIDNQREALYKRLGVEAPGVDMLKEHDDLKQAVDNMEITREKAVELAKYRKQQAELQARQEISQRSVQEGREYEQKVASAAQAMETYIASRAKEVDHPARMKIITDRFSDPAFMNEFVATYQPEQWANTVKMMYDNIQVQPRSTRATQQPISARPSILGAPSANAKSPIDRVSQHLDSMGIV